MSKRKTIFNNPGKPFNFFHEELKENWSFPEHEHKDFFEIVSVHTGWMHHTINGKLYHQGPRTLAVVRAHDTHALSGEKLKYSNLMVPNWWIHRIQELWGGRSIDEKVFGCENPPIVQMTHHDWLEFETQLKQLNVPPSIEGRFAQLSCLLINLLVNHLAKPASFRFARNPLPEWLEKTVLWIRSRRGKPVRVEDVVEYSNRCAEHVAREFKKHLGLSPSQFLNNQRLEHAAELLEGTGMTLLDVCYASGFDNPSYFHRLFKKNFGESPAAYRKNKSVLRK